MTTTTALCLGFLAGLGAFAGVAFVGSAIVMTFLKGADMAEERVWTADDDYGFREFARDVNGEA